MKSLEQLVEKINERETDIIGVIDFYYDGLIQFLPYEIAKDYFDTHISKEKYGTYYRPLNEGNVKARMEVYMKWAWGICLDEKGISSGRCLAILHAWLWILEDQEAIDFLLDKSNFPCYGAPVLNHICKKYGWSIYYFIDKWQSPTAHLFIEGKGCS